MDNAIAIAKKFGPPGVLGYAGVKVAQAVTAGSNKVLQVIAGVLACAGGVFLGMKFAP